MVHRKVVLTGLTAFALLPGLITAQAEQQEAKPPYTLTANVALVSDYFFRGITQTWGRPAIQGGADFAHDSGVYLGTFLSNISGNQFAGGNLEWDFYGGYNYKVNDDFTAGLGLIYYYYPGANYDQAYPGFYGIGTIPDQTYNTLEGNISFTWKWIGFKFSYAFTDYYGANEDTGYQGGTEGTFYPELNINYPVNDNLSLVAHLGYTNYKEKLAAPNSNGKDDPSYTDWRLGLSYTVSGWTFGAYYVDTSNKDFYKDTGSFANTSTKDLARASGYLSISRTF